MCGFAGFIHPDGVSSSEAAHILKKQTDAISRRGPDDSGFWIDEALGVGLGHRRLAIVDLSPQGHQPMVSSCGRFILIFNGEIYNHLEIRRKLSQSSNSIQWRGTSDTETLLGCFEIWGIKKTLMKLSGMFAFGVFDYKEKCLYLARDRFGEKPLYYGWQKKRNNNVFFSQACI